MPAPAPAPIPSGPVTGPTVPSSPGGVPAAPPPPSFVPSALRSGAGDLTVVSHENGGELGAARLTGSRRFEGLSLIEMRERENSGRRLLESGSPVGAQADGVIAWGRWTDGRTRFKDGSDDGSRQVRALHYFGFAEPGSGTVLQSYNAFASTAPTVTSSGGVLLSTGVENSAGGALRVVLPKGAAGLATYNLSVPVANQTFSLSGTAQRTGSHSFAGSGEIRSDGTGCAAGCRGALARGNTVQGAVGGAGNTRAGVVYGFTSGLGLVSGAIVFKP
jgi:hypothetical protein